MTHHSKTLIFTKRDWIEILATTILLTGICLGIMTAGVVLANEIREHHVPVKVDPGFGKGFQ